MEYADDIVLLFEEQQTQSVMDKLTEVIPSFGMHFAPLKCKVMLQVLIDLNTPLPLQGEILEVVDRFTYLEVVLALIAVYQMKLMRESRKPESLLPISVTYGAGKT